MPLYSSAEVVQRLVDRLKLQGYPVDPNAALQLAHAILPTMDVDRLLHETKLGSGTGDLTPAAGTFVPIFTVPAGKRWRLVGFWRDTTTGTTKVLVYDGVAAFNASPIQTAEQTYWLGSPLWLEEGWQIGLRTNGNAGDGSRYLNILYEEEDREVLS